MSKLLTIEDIRNPARKSGFDHVNQNNGEYNNRTPTWRAEGPYGSANSARGKWRGPSRYDATLAAQDYCDYINDNAVTVPATLATLDKSDRPVAARRTLTDREKTARAVIREETVKNPPKALHDPICYLIGVKGDSYAVKVGYADYNVYSRLDSLQTGNPRELVLLGQLPGGKATESALHAKYATWNILQEWFWPAASLLLEFGLTPLTFLHEIGPRNVLPPQRKVEA